MLRRNAITRLVQLVAILQIAASAALIAVALAALAQPAGASITGVCPDGSIFIVQARSAIPCSESKEVEPHDVPPLKPGLLPRPYGWDTLQRRQDPNNPYNAVEAAPTLKRRGARPRAETRGPEGRPRRASAPPRAEPAPAVALAARPPIPAPTAPPPSFTAQELADLAHIVELAQRRTPATFRADPESTAGPVVLRLARSRAFEPRLRADWGSRGGLPRGPVLLFAAQADAPGRFHARLTFVQDQTTFTPDAERPGQLGVIDGALGDLAPGRRVLGYAVLPESIDLGRPVDVYWHDRLLTATFE